MPKPNTNIDLEMTVPLRTTDFDRYRRLKPSSVLQLFQEAATRQAEKMGIGFADMSNRGVFWAVIRTSYDVLQQPQLFDEVRVRTWPHDPSNFSFLRDYLIKDSNGRLLLKGTSEWVLMNVEDRSFVPLFDIYDGTREFLDERNYESKPRKLRNFEPDSNMPLTVIPPYSSVDLNGHVNNSVYADFLFDALNPENEQNVRHFQIDYRREVREGKPLHIYIATGDACVDAKGTDDDGNIMFAARIEA